MSSAKYSTSVQLCNRLYSVTRGAPSRNAIQETAKDETRIESERTQDAIVFFFAMDKELDDEKAGGTGRLLT